MTHPRAAVLAVAVLFAAATGCHPGHGAAARPSASPSGPPAAGPSARTVPSNAAAKSTVGSGRGPSIGGCPSFPAGNVWNGS